MALGSDNQSLKELHELNRAGLTSGHVLTWSGSAFASSAPSAVDLTAYSTTSQADALYGAVADVTANGNAISAIEADYLVAADLSTYATSSSVSSGFMANVDPAFSGKVVQSGTSVSEERNLKFVAMTTSSNDVIKDYTLPASGSVFVHVKALYKNKGYSIHSAVYHNVAGAVGLMSGTDSSEFYGTGVVGPEVAFDVSASNVLSVRAVGNATIGAIDASFSLELLSV